MTGRKYVSPASQHIAQSRTAVQEVQALREAAIGDGWVSAGYDCFEKRYTGGTVSGRFGPVTDCAENKEKSNA